MDGLTGAQNKIHINLMNYLSDKGLSFNEMDELTASFISKYFSGIECDERINLINGANSNNVFIALSSKSIEDYKQVDKIIKQSAGLQR